MTRPTRILPVLALLALGACATPAQQCEIDAAAPYRAALAEQARNAKDLARGYTFKTKFERVTRRTTCRIAGGGFYPCFEQDMQPVTRKVPVDVAALEKRQGVLAKQIPELRSAAARDIAQCRAIYPQEPV